MKKLLLLTSAALMSISSFAQDQPRSTSPGARSLDANQPEGVLSTANAANKSTGLTTSVRYSPYTNQGSGPYLNYVADYAAPFDSGRLSGINVYNAKGFAQYYPGVIDVVTPSDSSLQINGLIARFTGTKSASSTKNVVFNIWKRDASKIQVTGRAKFYIVGLPLAPAVITKSVPMSSIITNNKGNDTGLTIVNFTTPLTGVNYNFYAGYTIAYTWATTAGDTIGLSVAPYVTGGTGVGTYTLEAGSGDTLVTSFSVIQNSAGTWRSTLEADPEAETNGALVIFPVYQISCPKCGLSVHGLTQNNLTIFGNYPNPAVNGTTVKFALKRYADVTISVMDATGKTVRRIKETGLAIGNHLTDINTTSLVAGTYTYLIETSAGDGMASQFTVAK